MSAFYDLADIVLVPSGYKSGKIYAQKPLTTDGQLTFTRASTATRVNASGLIETVASGVPRLDYLGSSCPKILLEPQRSNLITQSQTFDNAAWTKYNGATVTANTVVSPDGTQNADTLNAPAASTQEIYNGGSKAASEITYTFSCFAKYNGSIFTMVASDFATSGTTANFNLQTGTVTSISVGATWSNGSAKIENYGNGWYRCIFTATSPSSTGLYISLTGTTYIWGCEIEQGAYATSYIPTTTAAVTRVADAASKTGISSLIGQTEGTAFADLTIEKPTSGNADFLLLENTGTPTDGVYVLFMYQTGQIGFFSYPSAAFAYVNSVDYSGQRLKVAYAYSAAGLVIYINGTQVYSSGSVSLGTGLSTFGVNNPTAATISTKVSQTLIFKTRLTNAQLAELTTL
jgi:hypothetical protein